MEGVGGDVEEFRGGHREPGTGGEIWETLITGELVDRGSMLVF